MVAGGKGKSFAHVKMVDSGDGGNTAAPSETGKERKKLTKADGVKMVKRTIGWWNYHGGLKQPIMYKHIRSSIESISSTDALAILKNLEEVGPTINNPTGWVKAAAERTSPELDIKVKKTIAWYNRHGQLTKEIRYDEVKDLLGSIPPDDACRILKSLDGRGDEIRDPTAWVCKAVQCKLAVQGSHDSSDAWSGWGSSGDHSGSGGSWSSAVGSADVDHKVKKTIGWYNRNGGLGQEIRFSDVAPYLAVLDTGEALRVLKGLEGKGEEIRDPTAWIIGAVQRAAGGS